MEKSEHISRQRILNSFTCCGDPKGSQGLVALSDPHVALDRSESCAGTCTSLKVRFWLSLYACAWVLPTLHSSRVKGGREGCMI